MTKCSGISLRRQSALCATFVSVLALSCMAPLRSRAQASSAAPADANNDASSQLSRRVSHYVRNEMQRQHIPGAAVLVSRGGQIVQAQGFGLANVELQVPVKPETVFQSGSVG